MDANIKGSNERYITQPKRHFGDYVNYANTFMGPIFLGALIGFTTDLKIDRPNLHLTKIGNTWCDFDYKGYPFTYPRTRLGAEIGLGLDLVVFLPYAGFGIANKLKRNYESRQSDNT
jgi:hypothetical protein